MKLSNRDAWGRPKRYQSAADAKMSPYNGNDIYTKALLHFDGINNSAVITDSGIYPTRTWTANGNAVISTAKTEAWGGACLILDGSGDYVSTADSSDFAIGTGAFTDEIRCWPSAIGGLRAIIDRRIADNSYGYVLRLNGNAWTVAIGTTTVITASSTPSTSKFTHLAVVGNGGSSGLRTIKLYVDGVLAGTYTTDYNFTSTRIRIGTYWGSSSDYFAGWLDECRLSAQDRTANVRDMLYVAYGATSFTPPTKAYK